jgi:putative membrane protein
MRKLLPLLVFTAHVAGAQVTGNPAGLSPDTPGIESATPAASHANTQDRLFVRQASLGNRAEVDMAKMAQRKAQNAAVKEFAQRMERDHASSLERLTKAGKPAKMDIPKSLDAENQRVQGELDRRPAAEFDVAYLAAQIEAHQRTANLLLWQLSYGQNADLIRYSADTLPTVLDHLEHAKRAHATLAMAP